MIDTKNKMFFLIPFLLIILLGIAVYYNSLGAKFVWDDFALVRDNSCIKDLSGLAQLFKKNIWAGIGEGSCVYRPLQMVSFALDYSLWRLNVFGYHFTNILLHILVALSLYWLISILFRDKALSLFATLLFVVHPIHSEAVTYISGRADPLAALFLLFAFIFYLKHLELKNSILLIISLVSFALSLFSRENALIFPAVILLYHFSFKVKMRLAGFLSILALTIAYLILRLAGLGSFLPPEHIETTLLERLPGFFVAITNYTRLLILPLNLHMEYGSGLFRFYDFKVILGFIIFVSLLIYAFKKRNADKLASFSILWFFITLLPSSNIYPINAYMAEHWLYLPSIGFFLIVANSLNLLRKKGRLKASIAILACLLLAYSFLTIQQNNFWRNPVVFYGRTLKLSPNSVKIYNNLGLAYYESSKPIEAIACYEKALKIDPRHASSLNNLGVVYRHMGKRQEAIDLFKRALAINPDSAEAYYNLGAIYYGFGKKEEAAGFYKKAMQINPHYANACNDLGVIYKDLGDFDKAEVFLKRSLEINPDNIEAYNNLGIVYSLRGMQEEAASLFKEAIKIDPSNPIAYNNLGVVYNIKGDKAQAARLFKKALEIDPDYSDAKRNLR
ncbi:MAG: tetratricopeptide repeat protein [Candidatus Omnitrophica bacterium]|nr:tetratricopeptide repeat protein [Candidatus Omnitrophota bacterium]